MRALYPSAYSSSSGTSVAGCTKPCRLMARALSVAIVRTWSQSGVENPSNGPVSLPPRMLNTSDSTMGMQKFVVAAELSRTGMSGMWWLPRVFPAT